MSKMRAVQATGPKAGLQIVERPVPEPGAGAVRVKIGACGICHSDSMTVEGHWPGIRYPRVPGHEIAGVVDATGPSVTAWKVGDRVGVGWHGGHCGFCDACRRGDFLACRTAEIPGISYDGGYADYMIAPAVSLARIPDGLSEIEAAPLMCAGITVYNSLRHSGGRRSIAGWPSGTSIDSEDTLAFSVQTGVRSMNEVFPLPRAPEAYARMMSGEARFRVVLDARG